SLGDPTQKGNVAVRLYYKPLVLLIWLGGAIMCARGAVLLSGRRLRVGAPQPARARVALRAAEGGDETRWVASVPRNVVVPDTAECRRPARRDVVEPGVGGAGTRLVTTTALHGLSERID